MLKVIFTFGRSEDIINYVGMEEEKILASHKFDNTLNSTEYKCKCGSYLYRLDELEVKEIKICNLMYVHLYNKIKPKLNEAMCPYDYRCDMLKDTISSHRKCVCGAFFIPVVYFLTVWI